DDPNDSSALDTGVDIATCLNLAQQNWSVPATGKTGQIQINGRCLDTAGGGTTDGTGVVLASCSSTDATEQWTQGNGDTVINQGASTARGRQVCLDDPSGNT